MPLDERLVDVGPEKPARRPPPLWLVHGVLILGQCIFGGGSIVGKFGVAKFNPMVFALIREAVAGALLMVFAIYQDGFVKLHRRDALVFVGCGVFIFTNQAAFIIGDKLAGAVLASAWQPTQPVFTLVISIFLSWERCTLGKAAGILISFGGAAFMVIFDKYLHVKDLETSAPGNILLFLNCLATSLYVICAKIALKRGYPASTVTAWSYMVGAPPSQSSADRSARPTAIPQTARGRREPRPSVGTAAEMRSPARGTGRCLPHRRHLHGDGSLRRLLQLRDGQLCLSHREE